MINKQSRNTIKLINSMKNDWHSDKSLMEVICNINNESLASNKNPESIDVSLLDVGRMIEEDWRRAGLPIYLLKDFAAVLLNSGTEDQYEMIPNADTRIISKYFIMSMNIILKIQTSFTGSQDIRCYLANEFQRHNDLGHSILFNGKENVNALKRLFSSAVEEAQAKGIDESQSSVNFLSAVMASRSTHGIHLGISDTYTLGIPPKYMYMMLMASAEESCRYRYRSAEARADCYRLFLVSHVEDIVNMVSGLSRKAQQRLSLARADGY